MAKNVPINKSTLEQKWYYRGVKVLFLLLPFFMFLILFLTGKINIGSISSENIVEVFRNHVLYFVIGLLTFFIILELIWRLCLYILFGKIENDTKIKRSQAAQHLPQGNPATQSVAPTAQTVTQAAQVGPPAAQLVTPAIQPELVKPNPKTGKIAGTCL